MSHPTIYPPERASWRRMFYRCESDPHYIKAGITVCPEWHSFDVFMSDMGPIPSPDHSLDRIDCALGYSKANCRWATFVEQMNNRSINVNVSAFGETKTIAMWCKDSRCKTGRTGLARRIRRGVPAELAISFQGRRLNGTEA